MRKGIKMEPLRLNALKVKLQNTMSNDYSVAKTETVEENGKKIETAYNKHGQVLRTSVFVDRNKDGKYDLSEAVSIKFTNVDSKSQNTKEYRDIDNDGSYDEIIESDWTGMETIRKLNGKVNPESTKMSDAYGVKNSTYNVWFKK